MLIDTLSEEMDSIFNNTVPSYSSIGPIKLRPLPDSSMVEMDILVYVVEYHNDMELYFEQILCDVEVALQEQHLNNQAVQGSIPKENSILCREIRAFCHNNGELIANSTDNSTWSCRCPSGTSGLHCEHDKWRTTKAIIIAVICVGVPIIIIAVVFAILRHKRLISLNLGRGIQESTGGFSYEEMNDAGSSENSSHKVSNAMKTEENIEIDGFKFRKF